MTKIKITLYVDGDIPAEIFLEAAQALLSLGFTGIVSDAALSHDTRFIFEKEINGGNKK